MTAFKRLQLDYAAGKKIPLYSTKYELYIIDFA